MIRALDRRHEIYNETLAFLREKEADGTVLVIAPRDSLGIGRFEKERKKLEQAYQTGYEDTQRLADDLTAFFEQK